ncbi:MULTISPECIES: hypothetical protein [unclassified Nodularia (in: cyanobacteria)]|nr:hypothetical protein [Nodularia sp. LEGE 04288]
MFRLFTIAFRIGKTLDGYSFSNSQLVGRIKYNLCKLIIQTAIQM